MQWNGDENWIDDFRETWFSLKGFSCDLSEISGEFGMTEELKVVDEGNGVGMVP